MVLYGTGLNEPGTTHTDDGWVGSVGQGPPDGDVTTIDTVKPNHQYVCFVQVRGCRHPSTRSAPARSAPPPLFAAHHSSAALPCKGDHS